VVTLDLNTPAANQNISAAKRSTTTGFRREPNYRQVNLDIVAATFYEAGDDSNFRITTKEKLDNGDDGPSTTARWM
jgi:hypothetical protein